MYGNYDEFRGLMKKTATFFFLWAWSLVSYGQMRSHHSQFISGGLGIGQALSDLGGSATRNSFGPSDINWEATGVLFQGGYEWRWNPWISFGGELNFGYLRGDDRFGENEAKLARNLSFRTGIVELSGQVKFYLFEERNIRTHHLKGLKRQGSLLKRFNLFAVSGVGVMYFNPKAKYNGSWVALQPLGTEGQGIDPGTKKYSRFTFSIPVGMGIKYNVDKMSHLTLRASYHFLFTDYLDDVSDLYYDNDAIREAYGDVAADLANRSDPDYLHSQKGSIRGNSQARDGFVVINLAYHKRLKMKRAFQRKHHKRLTRGRKLRF